MLPHELLKAKSVEGRFLNDLGQRWANARTLLGDCNMGIIIYGSLHFCVYCFSQSGSCMV